MQHTHTYTHTLAHPYRRRWLPQGGTSQRLLLFASVGIMLPHASHTSGFFCPISCIYGTIGLQVPISESVVVIIFLISFKLHDSVLGSERWVMSENQAGPINFPRELMTGIVQWNGSTNTATFCPWGNQTLFWLLTMLIKRLHCSWKLKTLRGKCCYDATHMPKARLTLCTHAGIN